MLRDGCKKMAPFGDSSFLSNPQCKPFTPSLEVQIPFRASVPILDPGSEAQRSTRGRSTLGWEGPVESRNQCFLLGFLFCIAVKLINSQCCQFQVIHKGTQPCIYMYPFCPRLPSHPDYHIILSRVPVLYSRSLLVIRLNIAVCTCPSRTIPSPHPSP